MKFSIQDIDLDRAFTGPAGTCMLSACYSLHCPGPVSYKVLVFVTTLQLQAQHGPVPATCTAIATVSCHHCIALFVACSPDPVTWLHEH